MQLSIDFSGKKDQKITISVTEELRHTLETLSRFTEKELSRLCGEYVAQCAGRDHGILLDMQARGKITVDMAKQ